MILPEVKSIDWCDQYSESEDFPAMLALTVTIGEVGIEGGHNFQVIVCNPHWVSKQIESRHGFWPRGMLIVKKIDIEYVRETIQNLANTFCNSKDWNIFAERMNRYLLWEFEDYNDFQGKPVVPRPE